MGQVTVDGREVGGREIALDVGDWRDCYLREGTIEVPMLEPMRVACNDRGFVTIRVISVIAVTARTVLFVSVFVSVMMRSVPSIVMMDVRVVSSAMPMMNQAHNSRPSNRHIVQRVRCGKAWSNFASPISPIREARPNCRSRS